MLEAVLAHDAMRASAIDSRPIPAHITSAPNWYRPLTPQCIVMEAARQRLEPLKLASVLRVEGGRIGTFSANTNGSYDIGPMQINTVHLPNLARLYNLSPAAIAQLLAFDGCFNVAVGAYLLRASVNAAGGDPWKGVGRYHSRTPQVAEQYVNRVQAALGQLVAQVRKASATSPVRLVRTQETPPREAESKNG